MRKSAKIEEIMETNHLFGEVVEDTDNMVGVEIHWGDWKDEHLRLEYLVKEGMPDLKKVETEVTEENGSDCYSAIHRFYF